MTGAFEPYAPLNVPKPFGEDVWIVDGPEIRMDYGPITLPFPTRMTIVRLSDSTLWVHSPIAPEEELFKAVDALGAVRHLVAPNSIHYWYMADWLERYPEATTYAVPDLRANAKKPFRIDHKLETDAIMDWDDQIAWLLVPGTSVTEAVFHVRKAGVTILVDLIENFEPCRVRNSLLRWAIRLGRANGHTPVDLRWTFWPKRNAVREQVAQVLDWPSEKLVVAHGRPYETDGREVLRRELAWAIGR